MLITLLTDFGTQDTFVGVMKGVIKSIAPQAEIIDLTHQIAPQDVAAGAFALKTALGFFPPGTIHVAVVDPGVGSERRAIAARIGDDVYVAPDNGLLSYVLAERPLRQAVILDNSQYHLPHVSRTFHGRDIFAPAAAHLANGISMLSLGTPLASLVTLPLSRLIVQGETLLAHIISVDAFGNMLTDLTEVQFSAWADSPVAIETADGAIPGPLASYSDVPEGRALALFGSSGHLEIAVRSGSAQKQLHLSRGGTIILRKKVP